MAVGLQRARVVMLSWTRVCSSCVLHPPRVLSLVCCQILQIECGAGGRFPCTGEGGGVWMCIGVGWLGLVCIAVV